MISDRRITCLPLDPHPGEEGVAARWLIRGGRSQSTAPRLPANDRLQPNMPSGPALERVISGIFQGLKDRIEVQYQSPAAAFRAFDEESSGDNTVHNPLVAELWV